MEEAWDVIQRALGGSSGGARLAGIATGDGADGSPREEAVSTLEFLVERRGELDREAVDVGRPALLLAKRACDGLRDFVSIADLDPISARSLLLLATWLKWGSGPAHGFPLEDRTLALVFEKPSLRTRVTFDVAMYQLGGRAIHLGPADIGMGRRESVADIARNLERWVQGIAARTFSHESVVELAAVGAVPVINALSDREHPCQALADFMTLAEKRGRLPGLRLAYVGDGNNVANSLILLAAKLGVHVSLACPPGYAPSAEYLEAAAGDAGRTGAQIGVTEDPVEAVSGADAVYTDVWTSMGQEEEAEARERIFRPYQLNAALLEKAAPGAIALHCLPAHRGMEITDEVMDGSQSAVFDQAENRLHVQKAILAVLMS